MSTARLRYLRRLMLRRKARSMFPELIRAKADTTGGREP